MSERGEIELHAFLQTGDIGLGDLRPDGEGREIGNARQYRRCIVRVDGLAFARVDRYDRARHRCEDAGVVELRLVRPKRRVGLLDLRADGIDPAGRGAHVPACHREGVVAGRVVPF
jgi:hypothetical protein